MLFQYPNSNVNHLNTPGEKSNSKWFEGQDSQEDSFLYLLARNCSLPGTPYNELSRRSAFLFFAIVIGFVAAPLKALTFAYLGKFRTALCPAMYSAVIIPCLIFWTHIEPRRRRKHQQLGAGTLPVQLGDTAGISPRNSLVLKGSDLEGLLAQHRDFYHVIVSIHQTLALILPMVAQLIEGGLVKSGALFLTSALCPFGAALFCQSNIAIRWFILYAIATISMISIETNFLMESFTLLQQRLQQNNTVPINISSLFSFLFLPFSFFMSSFQSVTPKEQCLFTMNICGTVAITFFGALFFSDRFEAEYKLSEQMIDNILPRTIANRLKEVKMCSGKEKHGKCCIIGNFDHVTILFVKLVGFTAALKEYHPDFLIGRYLRDVFMEWDELCAQKSSVENIKTIADTFMVVGGLGRGEDIISNTNYCNHTGNNYNNNNTSDDGDNDDGDDEDNASIRNERRSANVETTTKTTKSDDSDECSDCGHGHDDNDNNNDCGHDDIAVKMVTLGLEMQEALDRVNDRYQMTFKCQIGIHTGSVIAGVIGVNKFAFDVWGDAVNTASRMESHSISGHLHMSSETYNRVKGSLRNFDDKVQCRGEIEVKGKGKMQTYSMPLPQRFSMRSKHSRFLYV